MTGLLLACLGALDGTALVTSLPITTRVDGRAEPAELRWVVRRDENERGVVPHDSGWMSYGHTPWLNHHLAVVTTRGGVESVRWMSSAVELDGLFTEQDDVVLRWRGALTRWHFKGWALVRSDAPPDPRLTARRLAARFDAGLVHLAAVGDVMLGRATALALDRVGHERAFADVLPVLARADLRLGNLEGCFREAAEVPTGALELAAPVRHRPALERLGLDVLSVANNHCTPADAATSKRHLADAGLVGVDDGVVVTAAGQRVGVVGLNLWPDPSARLTPALGASLLALRAKADVVVALVHFGDEYSPTPSPAQRHAAQWLLERGVQLVFGSHPHVQQPVEQPSARSLVAYSLGNFLFDQEGYPTDAGRATEDAVVLEVRVHRQLGVTWRTTPFRIVGRASLKAGEAPPAH